MRPAHEAQPIEALAAGLISVGGYQIVRKIGAGGMAEVFRAVATGPAGVKAEAAIKRIRPCFAGDDRISQMFLDEARLVAQLEHPNIVRLFAMGELEGQPVMVMELVEGTVLGKLRGRLVQKMDGTWPDVMAEIVRQISDGLSYAYQRTVDGQPLNLVHRDISPGNVMISLSGTVKLLDFGIAKLFSATPSTDPGTIVGKWGYMAPEQIAGQPVDQRTDVFSCGILLHELLTGRPLFAAGNMMACAQQVKDMPIPRPSRINALVPEALDEIVLRALERDPERRWPSSGALGDAIEAYLAQKGWRSSALTRILAELAGEEPAKEAISQDDEEPEIIEEITFVEQQSSVSSALDALGVLPAPAATPPPPPEAVLLAALEATPPALLETVASAPLEVVPPPALEAVPFEATPFEATPFEATSFEAVPFEATPFEATSFEATPLPLLETAPFEAAPPAPVLAHRETKTARAGLVPAPRALAATQSLIDALWSALPQSVSACALGKRARYAALALLLPVVGWSSTHTDATSGPPRPKSEPQPPPVPPARLAAPADPAGASIQDSPPTAPAPAATGAPSPLTEGALVTAGRPASWQTAGTDTGDGHWRRATFVPRQRHRLRRLKAAALRLSPFSE